MMDGSPPPGLWDIRWGPDILENGRRAIVLYASLAIGDTEAPFDSPGGLGQGREASGDRPGLSPTPASAG